MTIETKYNPGETVVYFNKAQEFWEGVIQVIYVEIHKDNRIEETYGIYRKNPPKYGGISDFSIKETHIGKTKEEVLQKISELKVK